MICISLSHEDQLEAALGAGPDLLELRLDLIGREPSHLFSRIPGGVRTVVTYRPGNVPDGERSRVLREAMELGASYVDLELEAPSAYMDPLMEAAASHACELILSHHDFTQTPEKEELVGLLEQCYERGADLAKIATFVRDREDVLKLISLYEQAGRKVILGMGASGRITRVLAPFLGSEFTFASMGSGEETAPGQLDHEQLRRIYQELGSP